MNKDGHCHEKVNKAMVGDMISRLSGSKLYFLAKAILLGNWYYT